MITDNQINALTEEELLYLVSCCNDEWYHQNMGYPFQFHYIKSWKNNIVQPTLNKYSNNLPDDKKNIIMSILQKLEENK
jgi:hypothetical protein